MLFPAGSSATLCLALVLAVGQRALAANDWSAPCTQGKCSWDLPGDSGASGTVNIWGSQSAISDITNATGWHITSCNSSAIAQKIQLVCKDGNPDCDHLFQGGGAVNTIVRLPNSCGPMPFARVAQHQILQSNLSSRASEALVHELALDTNFTAASLSQGDRVHFSIQGMSSKGHENVGSPAQRGHRRAWSPASTRDKIHRHNVLANRLNDPRDLGAFNKTFSLNTTPVDFSGMTNLFNTSIECPASTSNPTSSSASISLDVGADLHLSIGLGAVVAGSLIPPDISEFGLYFALDGNVDANLSVVANISGQVSSGNITLFQIGIPGLSFPGIFEIGPEFKLMSEIDVAGQDNISAVVDLNYDLSGVSLVFPAQASSNVGGLTPGTSHVTVSASPDIGATFDVAGHLIPQVDIGLSALGLVSTNVFLKLDASADFTVSTNVGASAGANPQSCVSASTDINVGVGAEGSFFGIFHASESKSLFDKEFPIIQKCFASANSSSATTNLRRRHDDLRARHPAPLGGSLTSLHVKRLDFGCP
ncbi:hypothetical protein BJV77DRAFT_560799 [Russula vinacea]|nr:hypothetical protein BJV77DRAFT_560799 [Russula vinacea]